MMITLVFLLLYFYLSSSLIVDLIILMLVVSLNSLVIFVMSGCLLVSFIFFLSIVGGLMIIFSFVIMVQPNDSVKLDLNNWVLVILFLAFLLSVYVDFSFPLSLFDYYDILLNFNLFSLFMFIFLVLVLLFMLFVVNEVMGLLSSSYFFAM